MTPDRLLANFDRISEAPDAIPRLRRFILDLAVQGKLVEQDPTDEPASEWLKRVQAEKPRPENGGKKAPYKQERLLEEVDLPFTIPTSWAWTRLDLLAEKITDGEHLSPNKTASGMPLLTATHVTAQGLTLSNPQFVTVEDGRKSRQRCDPRRGDVLICSRGTIGRCAVVNTDEIFCLMGSVILIRFPRECSALYFHYFLSTDRAQAQMRGMSGATAVQALYLKDIRLCPAAVPPLAEQHRIVAKMDELMALCDRLEAAQTERESRRDKLAAASLHRLNNGADADEFRVHARFHLHHLPRLTTRPEHIQQLRQTILNLATRGKLVRQDPNDEPASELLKRIGVENFEEQPFQIPDSWSWVSVGQIGDSRLGKMLDKAKNKGTPHRYLRNVNVRWFNFDLLDVFEMRFEDNELNEFALCRGDVLICEGGEPGRAAVWDDREKDIYFQKAIHRVRFPEGVNPHFFVNTIRESADSGHLSTYFTGVGIKHFTGKGLSSFVFPLPPLAEQHRIVAKVDELMALCDRLEAQLTTTQTESRRLLEAVLHEALSRNLQVAQ